MMVQACPASENEVPAGNMVIEAKALAFSYGAVPVFEGLSFSLMEGETLAVIGASGCGKSTLLYVLAGLLQPCAGTIIRSHDATTRRSVILQDYGLFPWKTVEENIALPLLLRKVPVAERRDIVARLVKELHLEGLQRAYPARLSGGQRQRVAIGRALAVNPDMLLMDEPFSSLDAITREQLHELVLEFWRSRGLAFVMVTHSIEEALYLGRKIMVLGEKPARPLLYLDNPAFGMRMEDAGTAFQLTARKVRDALAQTREKVSGV